MNVRQRSLLRPLVFACLAVPLGGCKQGIGDRCQLDSDCSSGRCVLPTGGSAQQGGTCQETSILPGEDSGAPVPDLSMVDAATSPPPDMAPAPADLPTD